MRRFIALLALSTAILGNAQQIDPHPFWGKVRYGGGLGLGFGNNSFNLQIAPNAIYDVNPYFSTGLGLQFNYTQFGDRNFLGYGGSFINLFNPIPSLQLSAELEQWRINFEESLEGGTRDERYWLTSLFVGVGYRTGNVTVGIRYDVLYDEERSLNVDPWVPFIRVFF